jgi:hypothetical protein
MLTLTSHPGESRDLPNSARITARVGARRNRKEIDR